MYLNLNRVFSTAVLTDVDKMYVMCSGYK